MIYLIHEELLEKVLKRKGNESMYNYSTRKLESVEKKYTISELIFSVIIVLLPFLYQYRGVGEQISLGELLLIPFLLFFIVNDIKKKILFNIPELLFYFWIFISLLICYNFSYFELSSSLTVFSRLIFYAILILVSKKHFNWNSAKKVYEIAVLIFSIYLLVQIFYYYTYAEILPTCLDYELIFPPEQRSQVHFGNLFRASSLFLEPSYFSLFCIPFLCLKPYESKLSSWFSWGLVVLAVFLSTAASGIMIIALVTIFIIYNTMKTNKISKSLSYILIGLVLFLLCVWLFLSDFDSNVLQRIKSGATINYRVIRGIIIFNELPLFHKFFGVGLNNLSSFMQESGISTVYDETNLNYVCSALQIANFSGIVGLVFFINYINSIRKKIPNIIKGKTLFWVMVFVLCYESAIFTYRFAFIYIILDFICRERKEVN